MKTRLILLAAGNSRRFGSNKLLYEIQGKPMYTYAIKIMRELLLNDQNRELYVVTPYEAIVKAVAEMNQDLRLEDRAFTVASPDSKLGISYSIKAGVCAGNTQPDYYVFMVADQPYLKTETVEKLIFETTRQNKIAGCLIWKEVPGNPVIFSKQFINKLLSLEGDQGGKALLKPYIDQICKITATCEEELIDKDR